MHGVLAKICSVFVPHVVFLIPDIEIVAANLQSEASGVCIIEGVRSRKENSDVCLFTVSSLSHLITTAVLKVISNATVNSFLRSNHSWPGVTLYRCVCI